MSPRGGNLMVKHYEKRLTKDYKHSKDMTYFLSSVVNGCRVKHKATDLFFSFFSEERQKTTIAMNKTDQD